MPKFKASFIGHLYQIKAKRDLYPSRLKQFNRGRSTKAAFLNDLKLLKEIYDSVYKVRTERSQAASPAKNQPAKRDDLQPTRLEHTIQDWNPLSVSRLEGANPYLFEQHANRVNSYTQSPNSIEIDGLKRLSFMKTLFEND